MRVRSFAYSRVRVPSSCVRPLRQPCLGDINPSTPTCSSHDALFAGKRSRLPSQVRDALEIAGVADPGLLAACPWSDPAKVGLLQPCEYLGEPQRPRSRRLRQKSGAELGVARGNGGPQVARAPTGWRGPAQGDRNDSPKCSGGRVQCSTSVLSMRPGSTSH